MNPLDFLFNGLLGGGSSSSSSAAQTIPYFQATTQGVSTFSSGVNPAALEAQVDIGGQLLQYNTINSLSVGGLMGLFHQVLGSGVQSVAGGITGLLSGLLGGPATSGEFGGLGGTVYAPGEGPTGAVPPA